MFENISLAIQGIWSHKLRSFLTMLGIIIGIASIISIVSTIKGTNEQIKKNLIGAGNNVVTVSLTQDGNIVDMEYNAIPDGVFVIEKAAREKLTSLGGVQDASFYRLRTYTSNTYFQNTAFNGNLYGIDDHYFAVNNYQLKTGRFFSAQDTSNQRKVVILDEKAAENLFSGQNALDKTLEIGGEPFVVVGTVAKQNLAAPTINTFKDYQMYADTSTGALFIPDSCWPILYQFDEPQNVAIRAKSTDQMTEAGNQVSKYLTETQITNSSYKYTSNDILKQAANLQQLSNTTNRQMVWIAGISLLVGGIGVMNIMMVSVTERTKEIGLKKAIGARKKRILMQFLTEAATLTCLGGLLGVAGGVALAQLMSKVMATPVAISIPACAVAVLFSMGIGIVFGIAPAVKAARMSPIQALRRD